MIDVNNKRVFFTILLLWSTTYVVGQRWHSYHKQDSTYGDIKFSNKLAEAFFRYTEHGESFASRNYIVNEGFTRYFEEPTKLSSNPTFPGHPVTGVKFRIRLLKVEKKMFSKVIDTIETNQKFLKVKSFSGNSKSEREILFEIDSCYLLDYGYRKAEYLFRLHGEVYHLKIIKKPNHPCLIRKLYTKEQLPRRYLYIFFKKIYLNSRKPYDNYSYSMSFKGKEFFR